MSSEIPNNQIESLMAPNNDDLVREIQLDMLRNRLGRQTYPGYPDSSSRLSIPAEGLTYLDTSEGPRVWLPEGPWYLPTHANRVEVIPDPHIFAQLKFRRLGLEIDAAGRPLHPWWREMIHDPSIGVVTGPGFYRRWGPNRTADPIVFCNNHVLLVKRGDNGDTALPGGHVDRGEDPLLAAYRELEEETTLALDLSIAPEPIYDGPIADIRATVNAWPHTTAYLFRLGGEELPPVLGSDDAVEAQWIPIPKVLAENHLFGAHRFLFDRALAVYLDR